MLIQAREWRLAKEPHQIHVKSSPFTKLGINHFTELENKSFKKFQNSMAATPIGRDGYYKPALLNIQIPAPAGGRQTRMPRCLPGAGGRGRAGRAADPRSGCTSLISLNSCAHVHPPGTDKETEAHVPVAQTPQNVRLLPGRATTVISTRPRGHPSAHLPGPPPTLAEDP